MYDKHGSHSYSWQFSALFQSVSENAFRKMYRHDTSCPMGIAGCADNPDRIIRKAGVQIAEMIFRTRSDTAYTFSIQISPLNTIAVTRIVKIRHELYLNYPDQRLTIAESEINKKKT